MNPYIVCRIRIILLCGMVLSITACSSFEYVIKAANYGTYGVILPDFHAVDLVHGARDKWGIYPGIPGVADDFKRFEYLVGYPHSLPGTLVITWQLAKLSDCKDIDAYKAMPPMEDYDDKIHIRKSDCLWTPIKDKIFHQRIDMAAIRASEAYQRVGERVKDSVSGYVPFARYKLVIVFIFNEDKLVVKTGNSYETGI